MKYLLFFLLTFCIYVTGFCQVEESKKRTDTSITLGGQMMISGNAKNIFYNMGGGGISIKFNKVALSVNFLPSLRYQFETDKITPALGFGPQLKLKERILFGMPIYYFDNRWSASVGIGYKFAHACAQ